MIKQFSPSFTLFLVLSDALTVLVALPISTFMRERIPVGRIAPTYVLPWPVYVIAVVLWVVVYVTLSLYSPSKSLRIVTEILNLTVGSVVAWLLFIGVLYLSFRDVSRLQMIYFLGIEIGLTWFHRVLVRGYYRVKGGRSFDSRKTIVVGDGPPAQRLGQALRETAWAGLYLEGYVTDEGDPPERQPVLGSIERTFEIITGRGIKEVIVVPSPEQEAHLLDMVYRMQLMPVNIRVVPQYTDLLFVSANMDSLGGVPLITLKEPSLNSFQRIIKRTFDIIVGLALLPFILPVMFVVAVLIRLEGPGPIFFRQERMGEGRVPFAMYKFRTMVPDAEKLQEDVNTEDEAGTLIHKSPEDPRVTRIGRILRRYSLDELPQIFNVLRGDMSLVGPRPEMPWLVDLYEDWQHIRFEVPQDITGWWQVTRGEESLMYLNTDADLYYIRNYSILLDLRILAMTVSAVLVGRGAY